MTPSPLRATALAERVARVRERIAAAARAAGREPDEVELIAISKTFGADRVCEVAELGVRAFGENRIQEAAEKIPSVNERRSGLEWHFVGALQRNKAARAVALCDVIQCVDRASLALALDRAAEVQQRRPRVLLQVNLDYEAQKAGVSPDDLAALADEVAALPHLELVGLMAIPRPHADPETMRPAFARLRTLAEELTLQHPGMRTLSMGMSRDFEVAIQEGATWVRVGTAVFGDRIPATPA